MKLLNEPSFSEIVQRTYELYRQNIKRLFMIALVVSVLYQLFVMFLEQSGLVDLVYKMMQDNDVVDTKAIESQVTSSMHLAVLIGLFFYLVLLPFATALFQNIVDESWQGKQKAVLSHVQFVLSKLLTIVISTLIVYLLIALSVIASSMIFGILGMLVYAFLIIYIPLILYDQKNSLNAVSESFRLTTSGFAKSLGIAVFCYLLLNLPSIGGYLVQNLTGTDNAIVFGIDEVVTIFLSAFIWPLVATLKLALYYALKARRYNLKVQNNT